MEKEQVELVVGRARKGCIFQGNCGVERKQKTEP